MKDEELEIEEPTGKFILDNLPFEKRFQTANGMYIHYSDVCQLLKKYHESKVKKLNKADVSGRSEQLISFLEWRDKQNILTLHDYTNEELVTCYLKEINCH